MTTKTMWIIIVIMTLSLLGIGIIQYIWFRSSVKQDEKNFNNKVHVALALVKERLMEDAHKTDIVMRKYQEYQKAKDKGRFSINRINTYKRILNSAKNPKEKLMLNFELTSNEILVNPDAFLDKINKDKLAKYLKYELEQQGITIPFEHGVYSNKSQSFFIMNGHYMAEIGATKNKSDILTGNNLFNSEYKVSLFNTTDKDGKGNYTPGYLKVYFPTKRNYLWRRVTTSIILSLLFSGLVLGSFAYTLLTIIRQKKISKMKTDFINNMTHEFKTPIATISLATDSITNPKIIEDKDKVKRFVRIIKQENSRMLNQVEKVLQMAKFDKKEFSLKKTKFDVHNVINQIIENVNLKISKRSGILRSELKAKNSMVLADKTHITNILYNLLDNAEKYSMEKPEITISTRDGNGGIWIDISDKGIGMNKEQQKNIFDKFYRVHTGNIHNVKGFGLGLSYVKAIVDAHKGSIKVKSALGEGSTFSIFLPQTQA